MVTCLGGLYKEINNAFNFGLIETWCHFNQSIVLLLFRPVGDIDK